MDALISARVMLATQWLDHLSAGSPAEDEALNEASRGVIRAMYEANDEAWLLRANDAYYVPWDGEEPLKPHCATVCLPAFFPELMQMCEARLEAPYTGPREDIVRMMAIMSLATRLGGEGVFWSRGGGKRS